VRLHLGMKPEAPFPVDIGNVPVFTGALLGAMLVFLFSALAIRAVGKAAQTVIEEVRRQFRENKGIMEGTASPEYGTCVDIVAKGALKAMVLPGILPVAGPVLVGVIFKNFSSPGMNWHHDRQLSCYFVQSSNNCAQAFDVVCVFGPVNSCQNELVTHQG